MDNNRSLDTAADKALARDLAAEFAKQLHAELGMHKMQIINERNEQDRYGSSCATHDFCDANEVMADAWLEVFKADVPPSQESTARDAWFWNTAWTLARHCNFDVATIRQFN